MKRLLISFYPLALISCTLTPHISRPTLPAPAQFKEAPGWQAASPGDLGPRGDWWALFQDPALNDLEARVVNANQTVAQAVANYDQARALVRESRSALLPSLSLSSSATQSRAFATQSAAGGNQSGAFNGVSSSSTGGNGQNRYTLGIGASWQADLFGSLREGLSQNKQLAAAAAGDLGNAILAAQGELARNYIQLRAVDAQRATLADTVKAYQRALTITTNRYNQGVAARLDVLQADAQLSATQANAADFERQRAVLEHAIAVLVGENPSGFSLPATQTRPVVPDVPAILPATLLERRPDVAAAERRVMAANEGVGIARSAFFPTLSLSADTSTTGSKLAQLFTSTASLWSLGANIADTLFDFGGRKAQVTEQRAVYFGTVARYKATALTAFQQTEDELVAARQYALVEADIRASSQAADRVEAITLNQYKAGIVAYTNVITAQATALNDRQQLISATSNRLQAAVSLIEAIGGGWEPIGGR